jgi:YVTN family beta-propeller protein
VRIYAINLANATIISTQEEKMKQKYPVSKYLVIISLAIFLALGVSYTDRVNAESPFLIYDDFDIDFDGDGQADLDTSVWEFHTHSVNNAYYEMQDGVIEVHSGVVSGSGGHIQSLDVFTPGDDVLIFETLAREDFNGGGYHSIWGFWGPNHDGTAFLGFDYHGTLRASFRASNQEPGIYVEFTNIAIDPEDWHVYKIELSNAYAKFYLDGHLLHTETQNNPQYKDLYLWAGRDSRGIDNSAYFDYVTLKSTPRFVSVPEPTPIPEDYRLYAYIPKYSESQVYVIDTTTNELVKTINVGLRPTQVKVSPFSSIAFATNSDSGSVSVIDTITQEVIHTLNVGGEPYSADFFMIDNIEYAYIANRPGYVNVIDVTTMAIVDTFSAGSWVDAVKIHPTQPNSTVGLCYKFIWKYPYN